ncbi:hypothetical protein L7F22_043385 [Adiantum nelumboides]|nr:hypothetical protein [Adiantum nelumboides]
MGNKSTRQREFIEERYTRPQGSFEYKDGDCKKLRRLILNGQLAPCYPGADEFAPELDECPICFLFFPSLNRSRCCLKSLCTECYLQIKASGYAPFTNCPFCKTPNYIAEYHGAKTAEEKYFEQIEEQKVIEAKIRIHQKELHEEEVRLLRHGELRLAEERDLPSMGEHAPHAHDYDIQHLNQLQEPFEHDQIQPFEQHGFEEEHFQQGSFHHLSGDNEIGLDMEEVMLMQAIWLSIKDQGQSSQEGSRIATAILEPAIIGFLMVVKSLFSSYLQDQGQSSQESATALQTSHSNSSKGFGLRRRNGRSCFESSDLAEMRGERVASGSRSLLEHANLTYMIPVDPRGFCSRSSPIEIPQNCPGGLVEDAEAAWKSVTPGTL